MKPIHRFLIKIFGIVVLVTCLIGGGRTEVLAFSLQLDPPSLFIDCYPGEQVVRELRVDNASDSPEIIRVYNQDWTYSRDDGSKVFVPAGSTPYSLGKNVRLSQSTMVIPGHGRGSVKLTMVVPTNAVGTLVGVVFFEGQFQNDGTQTIAGPSVTLAGRIGSIVYVNILGTARVGLTADVKSMDRDSGKVTIRWKNDGNTHIMASGSLLLMDGIGKVMGRLPIESIRLLPSDSCQSELAGDVIKGAKKGILTLTVVNQTAPWLKEILLQ